MEGFGEIGGGCRRRRGPGDGARPRDGELPDRGARARRPLVQLPQARRHRDDRRPRHEDRERARRDPELRQEVDRGGQGDACSSTASTSAATTAAQAAAAASEAWVVVRHASTGKKLGRDSSHRRALYANLACSLIEHGRIKTTEAKAKAVEAVRREDDHAGPARRPACAPAGAFGAPLPGDRAPAVLRRSASHGRPARRVHPDREARHAPGRRAPRWCYLELVDYQPS